MQPTETTEGTRSPEPDAGSVPAPSTGVPSEPMGVPATRPRASGLIVASGVILLVLAVLAFLWALLFAVYGLIIGGNNPAAAEVAAQSGVSLDVIRPVVYGFVGVTLVIAVLHTLGGIGVLARREWGRIVGFVVGGLGILANAIGLVVILVNLGTARTQIQGGVEINPVPGLAFSAFLFAAFGAAYLFVIVALAMRGAEFRSR